MRSHEFESINLERSNTNISITRDLREKCFIKDGSPLWWGTDHAPDPREYISFDEFIGRLVYLGNCRVTSSDAALLGLPSREKDVYLYPDPRVPISVIELDVNGQNLPLLITVRPYHEKELDSSPFPVFLNEHRSIEELPDYITSGGVINLPEHFFPHIRGLFVGKRGNNHFWYPLHTSSWRDFGRDIEQALAEKKLSFIGLYQPPMSDERTYGEVWNELKGKGDLVEQRSPKWIDFPSVEVSVEEFIKDHQRSDLLLFYPIRLEGIDNTLPLVITSKTHKESKVRRPIVLGIYAENGLSGRSRRSGILRIKQLQLAEDISRVISEDFGIPVDTLLFTPQKGRPKYQRVSSTTLDSEVVSPILGVGCK
ncbi:MAG: hypothetical protein HYT07_01985 [Candidatus Levybacteria bacterium]|nr:hypothetical protein [Candidatus Levybacteria bacterium]